MKFPTLKSMSVDELNNVSLQLRERILQVVSANGGHLSSSLGAVDLIVAMHYVFDASRDPFIFDVSHQAYAHKLLTDRWESFETMRTFGGLSGYCKPSESPYDYFAAGHSSTSISAGVGAAHAIALKGEDRIPVVLIGDGSMSAGMVYEALNELGDRKFPMVVIINDNEMSIGAPIGAISRYLSQALAGKSYQTVKKWVNKILEHLPSDARYLAKKFEESLKLITPGLLFEELGLDYIGPVDGHDIKRMIEVLNLAKNLNKPVVVHVQTVKGKGYPIAEGHHEKWHGVAPFDLQTGEPLKKSTALSATALYAKALEKAAIENERVVGLTAAMPSGTGLDGLMKKFPDRFWDVAIAEQHAVTSAASLAKEGFRPFCTIYSTFLQRGFDQVLHDVALQNYPVIFALDRAGIVGEDGETHQGVFDIAYLSMIPNMVLFAPSNAKMMEEAVNFAVKADFPCAFRYPRGAFSDSSEYASPFVYGKGEIVLQTHGKIAILGYGNGVGRSIEVAKILKESNIEATVVDLRFAKPLDCDLLKDLSLNHTHFHIVSDSAKIGGVASLVREALLEMKIDHVDVSTSEYEDSFITHGATQKVEEALGVTPIQIAERLVKEVVL